MMGTFIGQLFSFVFYIAAQVFFVRNLSLFGYAFCFVYVAFLLLLPFETNLVLLLLLGFVTGLTVDVFYDTLGIHAAACVLLAFVRPTVIKLLTSRGDLDEGMHLSIKAMGTPWFLSYAFILLALHHTFLFFLEAASISLVLPVIIKAVCSTVFSLLVIVILQFFKRK
jgi:hypothetical protein